MSGWILWSTCNGVVDIVFPCLRELNIYDCPQLIDISLEALPSLRILRIEGCGDSVLRSMVCVTPSLLKLVINNIVGLSDEAWRGVIKNIGALEHVRINSCNEIRHMWESEEDASKVLMNLRYLEVNDCSKLVRLGEKEEDCRSNLLTSLRILRLKACNNLKYCSCPGSIETLEIRNCSSITSVSFPTGEGGGMQKLKSLFIEDCKELVVMGKELLGGGKNTNNRMLKYVFIEGWPHLKSMNGILNSIQLTSLIVWNCENMESFPDLELPNLASLTHLTIAYCPSMDGCFPRGHWPPKLTTLVIGWLKKPISEWGPQNFPNSLVELTLEGSRGDEVKNLSQLSSYHLFPSNLTSLALVGFERLETVSVGLQHLVSLKHLEITYCPKLKDLPQKPLTSLLSLTIKGCPKLKEKTNKVGRGSFSYWPKMSHIPCIKIDGELQN